MKKVIVIQARMTSTRLPGKILMEVAGRPMLAQQIRRLKQCTTVNAIVIATTTNQSDDLVVALAEQEEVDWFRGSESDVLSRFVGAARQAKADVVIRVTADCPLIDPQVVDRITLELMDHATECDYASNVTPRTYPRGLDAEVFFWDTLLRADRLAQSPLAREHVTTVIYSERSELFLQRSVVDKQNNADLRWTVDTPLDLELVRLLYSALDLGKREVPYQEVVAYVRANPELARMNQGIRTWEPPRRTA